MIAFLLQRCVHIEGISRVEFSSSSHYHLALEDNLPGDSSGIGDKISRVTALSSASTRPNENNVYSAYSYNGAGRMVVEDFVQPDVRLDHWGQTADTYAGFDRFGRVTRQLWKDYDANASRDHYNYGYDRSSNRKWRENTLTSGKDEYFTYDRLNRLTSTDRGDLTGTYPNYTGISGTPAAERDYTLDALGNWTDYIEKSSGSTTLDQDRTHNPVNEIAGITEGGGEEAWIDPAWDARGNMTTVPKPSDLDLAGGLTCAYDSWNRLAEVKQGETVVAKYEYDGLNRRVKKHIDEQSPADPNGVDVYQHFFYNVGWQALETHEATSENDGPEGLNPEYQFVWSGRYIDAPILRDENKDGNSDCISGTDERLYYLTDAQMNVTCLVDTGGDAVERYVYDPYGTVTIYDDDWSDTRSQSSYANPILFAGYYRDGETHLYYVRNRMYHPPLGRWLQRDPVGYADGMSLYEYMRSNPTVGTDEFGPEIMEGRKRGAAVTNDLEPLTE